MPTDDLESLNQSSENMALLMSHQHSLLSTPTNTAAVLPNRANPIPPRFELILSQCHTKSEIERKVWDNFEIHRRSADTYMNKYLDCLQLVHEDRCRQVYEVEDSNNESPLTGKYT